MNWYTLALLVALPSSSHALHIEITRDTPDLPWVSPYKTLIVKSVDVNESDIISLGSNGRSFTTVNLYGDVLTSCSFSNTGDSRACLGRPPGLIVGCTDPTSAVRAVRSLVGARFTSYAPAPPRDELLELNCGHGGPYLGVRTTAGVPPDPPVSCVTSDTSLELRGIVGAISIGATQPATIRCTGEATVKLSLVGGGIVDMGIVRAMVRVDGVTEVSLHVIDEARVDISATLASAPDRAGVFSGAAVMTTNIE